MEDVLVALRKIPFGRILLAFISGIVFQYYLQLPVAVSAVAIVVLIALLVAYPLLTVQYRFTTRWLQGAVILSAIAVTGSIVVWLHQARHQPAWYGHAHDKRRLLLVTIEEPPVEKPASWKTLVTVQAIADGSQWKLATGRLLVYFRKDTAGLPPAYGTQLVINKELQPVTGYGNPGGFDYAGYCAWQQVYHQVYLLPQDYAIVAVDKGSAAARQLYHIRDAVLNLIHCYLPDKQVAGVAAALLMGYRGELDKELLSAYAQTGVVHIIAISGMHLAMIYGILYVLLGKLGKGKYMPLLRSVIILLVLWFFTLLAGGVPSILRSAVMFSFIVAGEAFYKKHNACNNLAASAFLLLAFNPFYLWDIGFQLSYAAVTSVVLFYKPVYHSVVWQNRLLDYLWQLLSVTLAAQVLTLPLVLYHFHQFPAFFLLSNLVAVPLSGVILYGGIVMIAFAWWPWLAAITGWCVSFLIVLMNTFVKHMKQLPAALIEAITFNGWQVLLLFLVILCCGYGWWQKQRGAWFLAVSLLVALVGTHYMGLWKSRQQKRIIVYNIPAASVIEVIYGTNGYFAGDTAALQNQAIFAQHIQPAHTLWQVQQSGRVEGAEQAGVFAYAGKKIAFINGSASVPGNANEITAVDILILGKEAGERAGQLAALFRCKQLVFDSSNPVWKIEKWKKACDSLHLRFHSVPRDGAFVMEL